MAEVTVGGLVYIEKTVGGKTVLVPKAGTSPIGSGSGNGDMLSSNNLSDLASIATAKTNLGLNNVDNTSDANKPVSTATQTALDAEAASRTAHTSSTSNPHTVTKAQVGLSNVDNTADTAKPVSTATQTALDAKLDSSKLLASGMGFVDHGATASTARPTGYAAITWRGSVEPTNIQSQDLWIDTN